MRQLKLGTLTAHVTGGTDREGGGTGPVVVLLHGYGAPGTDLVPLWRELAVPHEVRFVFPEAPLELGFGGRAWWPIDMARLQDRFSKAAVERLIAEVPPGLDAARGAILELLAVLERDFAALPEQTVLGGFSQGAMLATDTVLRTSRPFGGLALLSGTLICHDEWLPLMNARKGLPCCRVTAAQIRFCRSRLQSACTQSSSPLVCPWSSLRSMAAMAFPVAYWKA